MGVQIVHLGKFNPSTAGGIESYVRDCVIHQSQWNWVDKIYSVAFWDSNRKPLVEGPTFQGGKIEERFLKSYLTLRSAPIPSPFDYRKIAKEIGCVEFVHFHHPNPSLHPLLIYLEKQNPRLKLIVHYHSDIERQRILRGFYAIALNRLLGRANLIVATSPHYLRSSPYLRRWEQKSIAIPFGIDARVKAPQAGGERQGPLKVLSCGRMVSYKGFEFLIRAVAKLTETGASLSLTLVGDGPLKKSLLRLSKRLGIDHRIFFKEHLSRAELDIEFESADVFVLPSVSRTEAFGIVIMEAMAFGKPVITTALGTGTDYLVRHEQNGLVVDPESVEALATALNRFIQTPQLCDQMGEESRSRVHSHFLKSTHYSRLQEAYLRLM